MTLQTAIAAVLLSAALLLSMVGCETYPGDRFADRGIEIVYYKGGTDTLMGVEWSWYY